MKMSKYPLPTTTREKALRWYNGLSGIEQLYFIKEWQLLEHSGMPDVRKEWSKMMIDASSAVIETIYRELKIEDK